MSETIKLGEICSVLSGYAFKSKQFGKAGIPIIRIRDVVRGYSKTFFGGSYDKKYEINNGDILIGMDGDFNTSKWSGGTALLNQRVCKIEVDETKLCKSFIYYLLPIKLKKIWNDTPFVTVKHLSAKKILDIDVPNIPLKTQKHIAAVLEKADQLRKDCQQMEQELNQLAQSVFIDMFGDPVTNPKGWEIGSIQDLLSSANYGTSSKASEEKLQYPVLRMNNITYQGGWNFTSLKYMNLTEKEEEKYLVEKGDLLFNRTNSRELVGKTAVYNRTKQMAYAGYLVRARCNKRATPEYISAFMNSKYTKQTLRAMCKSIVGMANINAKEFQKIKIPLAPKDLQLKFSQIIKQNNHLLEQLQEELTTYENLFNALSQKAFKGELKAPT